MNALLVASALALAVPPAHSDHAPQPLLGRVAFQTSCKPAAQMLSERGLAWLHSFEYEEAERAFTQAAVADPGCGIAHWGVAMSNYHPLWAPPTPAEFVKGTTALAKARAGQKTSKREREYIAALGTFFADSGLTDYKTRVLAYETAMERLHRDYPADQEAAVLYALSLIAAGLLDDDPKFERETRSAAILNAVVARAPDHPGAAHYLIHGFDYPSLAHLAVPAARRYAKIAPASAHAQHMPSHIFTRLGLWDDAIRSNKAAEAAARSYATARAMPGSWDERLHAMDYLVYAYLQTGRDREAALVLHTLNQIQRVDPPNFKVAYAASVIPARLLLERRKWREAAALSLSPNVQNLVPWAKFGWAGANIHFARGVGAARSGNPRLAREQVAKLREIEQALTGSPGEYDWRKQVTIQRQIADAWVAFAEGHPDQSLIIMRSAAALDDATDKHPVTPGAILPAREQLAELLLEIDRPAEALKEFENALQRAPQRLTALSGAARAAKLAGNKKQATRYYAALMRVTKNGNGTRSEIQEARSYLASARKN